MPTISAPRSRSTGAPTWSSSERWRSSRHSSRSLFSQREQAVDIDIGGKMACELVEGLIDETVIGDRTLARAEALEPGRALAVVGEEAMDIGADDVPIL